MNTSMSSRSSIKPEWSASPSMNVKSPMSNRSMGTPEGGSVSSHRGNRRPSPGDLSSSPSNFSFSSSQSNSRRRAPSPGRTSSPGRRAPSPGRTPSPGRSAPSPGMTNNISTAPRRPPSPGMGMMMQKPSTPRSRPSPGIPGGAPSSNNLSVHTTPSPERQRSVRFDESPPRQRFIFSKSPSGTTPAKLNVSSNSNRRILPESNLNQNERGSKKKEPLVSSLKKNKKQDNNPLRNNPLFLKQLADISDSESDEDDKPRVQSRSKLFQSIKSMNDKMPKEEEEEKKQESAEVENVQEEVVVEDVESEEEEEEEEMVEQVSNSREEQVVTPTNIQKNDEEEDNESMEEESSPVASPVSPSVKAIGQNFEPSQEKEVALLANPKITSPLRKKNDNPLRKNPMFLKDMDIGSDSDSDDELKTINARERSVSPKKSAGMEKMKKLAALSSLQDEEMERDDEKEEVVEEVPAPRVVKAPSKHFLPSSKSKQKLIANLKNRGSTTPQRPNKGKSDSERIKEEKEIKVENTDVDDEIEEVKKAPISKARSRRSLTISQKLEKKRLEAHMREESSASMLSSSDHSVTSNTSSRSGRSKKQILDQVKGRLAKRGVSPSPNLIKHIPVEKSVQPRPKSAMQKIVQARQLKKSSSEEEPVQSKSPVKKEQKISPVKKVSPVKKQTKPNTPSKDKRTIQQSPSLLSAPSDENEVKINDSMMSDTSEHLSVEQGINLLRQQSALVREMRNPTSVKEKHESVKLKNNIHSSEKLTSNMARIKQLKEKKEKRGLSKKSGADLTMSPPPSFESVSPTEKKDSASQSPPSSPIIEPSPPSSPDEVKSPPSSPDESHIAPIKKSKPVPRSPEKTPKRQLKRRNDEDDIISYEESARPVEEDDDFSIDNFHEDSPPSRINVLPPKPVAKSNEKNHSSRRKERPAHFHFDEGYGSDSSWSTHDQGFDQYPNPFHEHRMQNESMLQHHRQQQPKDPEIIPEPQFATTEEERNVRDIIFSGAYEDLLPRSTNRLLVRVCDPTLPSSLITEKVPSTPQALRQTSDTNNVQANSPFGANNAESTNKMKVQQANGDILSGNLDPVLSSRDGPSNDQNGPSFVEKSPERKASNDNGPNTFSLSNSGENYYSPPHNLVDGISKEDLIVRHLSTSDEIGEPPQHEEDSLLDSTLIGQDHVNSNEDDTGAVAEWWDKSYAHSQSDNVNTSIRDTLSNSQDNGSPTKVNNYESDDDVFFGLDDESPTKASSPISKKGLKKIDGHRKNSLSSAPSEDDSDFDKIMKGSPSPDKKMKRTIPPPPPPPASTPPNRARQMPARRTGDKYTIDGMSTNDQSTQREASTGTGTYDEDTYADSRYESGTLDDNTGTLDDNNTYDEKSYSSRSSRSDGSYTYGSATLESIALNKRERKRWNDWDRKDQDTYSEYTDDYTDDDTYDSREMERVMERRARAHEQLLMHAYNALSKPPPTLSKDQVEIKQSTSNQSDRENQNPSSITSHHFKQRQLLEKFCM